MTYHSLAQLFPPLLNPAVVTALTAPWSKHMEPVWRQMMGPLADPAVAKKLADQLLGSHPKLAEQIFTEIVSFGCLVGKEAPRG